MNEKLENLDRSADNARGNENSGFFGTVYRLIYLLGLSVIRVVSSVFTSVFFGILGGISKRLRRLPDDIKEEKRNAASELGKKISSSRREAVLFTAEMRRGFSKLKRQKNPLRRFKMFARYVKKAFSHHGGMLRTAFNIVLPAAALAVFLLTAGYMKSVTVALEVTYDNRSLGYIGSEAVYMEALRLIDEKIDGGAYTFNSENPSTSLSAEYKLKPVSLDQLNDANTICDKVIESSASNLTNACGVYVDGAFLGAVKNEADAKTVFDNYLGAYAPAEGEDFLVDFVQNIDYVQGLYSDNENIIIDAPELEKKLNSQKLLSIRKTVTASENVSVDFDTVKTKDNSKYQGYEKVTRKGVKGVNRVTTTKIYIDGELEDTKVEVQVVRAPVSELKTVGGKSYYGGADVGSASSYGFLWPAPSCHYISSPYGYRRSGFHKGVDLCRSDGRANGTAVIASKSGTVEYAGWNTIGYGNMVLINHGNGVKTRYAHMLSGSICVSVGERVYAGQQIGRVGSTGNSTGPHLHFEVIIGGDRKNPMNYLK